MKNLVSATELARQTGRVRRSFLRRRLMVVARRGKPVALLIATNQEMFQTDLAILRWARVGSRPEQSNGSREG